MIAETDLGTVLATLGSERPDVCVIDSVQTLGAVDLTAAPGSVGQVREVAGRLMENAKRDGVAVILVGHVTKEGSSPGRASSSTWWTASSASRASVSAPIAPSERSRTASAPRTRSVSSRCASRASWRWPTPIPASAEATLAPGSVVVCAMEGSRPLLVELQALVAPTELVPPRRIANGVDRNRLALVLAVLARHAARGGVERRVRVGGGGVRVEEPGADLGIASRWRRRLAASPSETDAARSPPTERSA